MSASDPLDAPNSGVGNPLYFTAAANVTGLPSLALPAGLDSRGGPIGMQIMGPIRSDFALLDLGAALQAQALPPLGVVSLPR